MRLIHKGLILVGVPLLLAVVLSAVMFSSVRQLDQERAVEIAQRKALDNSSRTLILIGDLIYRLQQVFVNRDPSGRPALRKAIQELQAIQEAESVPLVEEADGTTTTNQKLVAYANDMTDRMRELFISIKQHRLSFDKLLELREMNSRLSPEIYALAAEDHDNADRMIGKLQERQRQDRAEYRHTVAILAGGVILSIVIAFALARWFMTGIVQRLQVIVSNTTRMALGQPLAPRLRGKDEIAELDRGFHDMARALRAAMDREHALFEGASDVMCVLDDQFRFTAVNPACVRVLGYTQQELIGTSLLQFILADDAEGAIAILRQAQTKDPAASLEARVNHKDGTTLDLIWSVYWSEMDRALYAVAHDISDRKQTERMKEEFLAMVSHDLRGPLSSIFGTYKLISVGALGMIPDSAKQKVSSISESVNRLLGLVNDLLDIEKLSAGKLELVIEPAKVEDVLNKAISEVRQLADKRRITISASCSAADFSIDADRIMQVLVNLLSNAIKFSPDDSAITIKGSLNGERLRVEVVDQGRGIPVSMQAQVFERFKQVKSADGRRSGGTGLGLPICKQIVLQHGGDIGVSSALDRGSTFWFEIPPGTSLPAVRAASERPAPVAKKQPPAVPSYSAPRSGLLKKGVILVVIPVVFELIFAGSLLLLFTQASNENQKESNQRMIALTARDMLMGYISVGLSMSLHPVERAWDSFQSKSQLIEKRRDQLTQLTNDDPQSSAILAKVKEGARTIDAYVANARKWVKERGIQEGTARGFSSREKVITQFVGEISAPGRELVEYADKKGDESPVKLEKIRRGQILVLCLGLGISLLIGAFSAYLFSKGLVRRLRVTEDNVGKLERDEQLNPMISGADEVAHLDQVFHSMAAALKEARHKERAVFDNSQDVILTLDENLLITSSNPASEKAWGQPRAKLIGKPLLPMISDSQPAAADETFAQVVGAVSPLSLESKVERRDGSSCDVLWSLSWSARENTIIAIAHDISQRKELERLKQEFLAMVSHDMRTPLAAVLASSELLALGACGELPPKAVQQIEAVIRNCDRLLDLINDLLDIEKLESGLLQLEVDTIEAASVLQRTAESLFNVAAQKNIDISIDAAADLFIRADGNRLVQVGVNLLSNAIKFSPEGSVITMRAVRRGDAIEFQVTDKGRGIPESHISAVFERYKQVEAADGKRKSGTGLGLPICKQIVEQHGGTIGVSSEVGKGSTFYFSIPSIATVGSLEQQATL